MRHPALLLTLAWLGAGAGALARAESTAARLATEIVAKGYQRVGVLPRFLSKTPGGAEMAGGTIGPQADEYAEKLTDSLINAEQGRYTIVEARRMRKAFKALSVDDLADKAALAKVADGVNGLDALVVGTVTDERQPDEDGKVGGLNIRCELIALRDGSVAAVAREQVGPSLADGAYMGESWELRRWDDVGLTNVGLNLPADGIPEDAFGSGHNREVMQYPMIRRDKPHPLLDPTFPFPTEILVNGQPRPLTQVGEKVYVALDPGESYAVAIRNQSPRGVYDAVFIDGINILGKVRENPAACRYWNFAAGSKALYKGWFSGESGKFLEEEFMITQADATVAAGQGFNDNLGLITVVFFTVGMKDVPEPPRTKAMRVGGTFGTGTSTKTRELTLEMKNGEPPGAILAAATVHYATTAQLKKLQAPSSPVDR